MVEKRHLIAHGDDVTVLERDDAARSDPDVLAGGRHPYEIAAERPGHHVEGSGVGAPLTWIPPCIGGVVGLPP